jgi:hypothetical protein
MFRIDHYDDTSEYFEWKKLEFLSVWNFPAEIFYYRPKFGQNRHNGVEMYK